MAAEAAALLVMKQTRYFLQELAVVPCFRGWFRWVDW